MSVDTLTDQLPTNLMDFHHPPKPGNLMCNSLRSLVFPCINRTTRWDRLWTLILATY